ncbi:hypothetical protein HDU96_008125 [Phlyctochytrium bullatum]|nr:hypothetical protein HDU96_008125 [Phlyctochytrium bullatum]
MPVRLVTAILMMCLFTYVLLIAQVFTILDSNAQLSCACALYREYYVDMFAGVSNFMGMMVGAQSFGSPFAETLLNLGAKIRDETSGAKFVDEFFNILKASVITSMALSALVLLFNTVDFAKSVQKDIQKIRAGDYSRIGDYLTTGTNLAVQFIGVQVGYVYMGTLYMMSIMLVFVLILSMFFRYSFFRELIWRFALQNGLVIISIVVGLVLVYAQRYTIDIWFVAKLEKTPEELADPENAKLNKNGKAVINTRYWLARKAVWFLFPNLISGLLSFVANLIMMILGSALYAYRLDKKTEFTLPFMGTKSSIYFSWLLQEHHHTNPILVIFVKLLTDWYHIDRPLVQVSVHHERVKRRWQLLYTLLKNPGLQPFRKHRVRETLLRNYIAKVEFPQLWEQRLRLTRAEMEKEEAPLRAGMKERERAVRDLYNDIEKSRRFESGGSTGELMAAKSLQADITRKRSVLTRGITMRSAPIGDRAFYSHYPQQASLDDKSTSLYGYGGISQQAQQPSYQYRYEHSPLLQQQPQLIPPTFASDRSGTVYAYPSYEPATQGSHIPPISIPPPALVAEVPTVPSTLSPYSAGDDAQPTDQQPERVLTPPPRFQSRNM